MGNEVRSGVAHRRRVTGKIQKLKLRDHAVEELGVEPAGVDTA